MQKKKEIPIFDMGYLEKTFPLNSVAQIIGAPREPRWTLWSSTIVRVNGTLGVVKRLDEMSGICVEMLVSPRYKPYSWYAASTLGQVVGKPIPMSLVLLQSFIADRLGLGLPDDNMKVVMQDWVMLCTGFALDPHVSKLNLGGALGMEAMFRDSSRSQLNQWVAAVEGSMPREIKRSMITPIEVGSEEDFARTLSVRRKEG